MHRTLSAIALFLALSAFSAPAADLTGTWKGVMPQRDDRTRELVFKFKQNGERLTGVVVGMGGDESPISEGKVSAGGFSFALVGPRGKMICKGALSGSDVRLIQNRDGAPDQTRELLLKRQ